MSSTDIVRIFYSYNPQMQTKQISGQNIDTLRFDGWGTNHVVLQSQVKPSEWSYAVNIRNATTDIFDEIVIFYDRVDAQGVIFLREIIVKPNQIRTFRLSICRSLKSYVVGFFIGSTMVARIPPGGGVVTRNPNCSDSWTIS
jgi:hypothetical protein